MTNDTRTITESEFRKAADSLTNGHDTYREFLAALNFTVVPDPAPPLPTEDGCYMDREGDAWSLRDGDWLGPAYATFPANHYLPFTRLETEAEGDERRDAEVVEILAQKLGWFLNTKVKVVDLLRVAREANANPNR